MSPSLQPVSDTTGMICPIIQGTALSPLRMKADDVLRGKLLTHPSVHHKRVAIVVGAARPELDEIRFSRRSCRSGLRLTAGLAARPCRRARGGLLAADVGDAQVPPQIASAHNPSRS